MTNNITRKTIVTVLILTIVMVGSIGFSFVASKPEFYESTIEILDEKKAEA